MQIDTRVKRVLYWIWVIGARGSMFLFFRAEIGKQRSLFDSISTFVWFVWMSWRIFSLAEC